MTAVFSLRGNQRGDTLVEVMLATVIMSVIVSASFALVNRASRINQVSSERSEAANAMQNQAELLRLYRNQDDVEQPDDVWDEITDEYANASASDVNKCRDFINGEETALSSGSAFYFDDVQAIQSFDSPSVSSPNVDNRYFVWVEAKSNNGYIDFFVHSCWDGPGGTGPQQASLIYRLGT